VPGGRQSPPGSAPPPPGLRRHPARSRLAHAQHSNPVGVRRASPPEGRPRGEPDSPAGEGWPKKRRPAAERQRENGAGFRHLRRRPRITGRIRAGARPERELTWARWAGDDRVNGETGTDGHVTPLWRTDLRAALWTGTRLTGPGPKTTYGGCGSGSSWTLRL